MSPTAVLKIPIISEIPINVALVCVRSTEKSGLVDVAVKYPAVALINVEEALVPGTDMVNTPGPRDRAGGCHLSFLVTGPSPTSVTGFKNPEKSPKGHHVTDMYPCMVFSVCNSFTTTVSPGTSHYNGHGRESTVAPFHD